MNAFTKRALLCAGAISLLAATPASACQGIQFESSLHFLSEGKADELPEGTVQYKVHVPSYTLRGIEDRSLVMVQIRNEETGKGVTEAGQPRRLAIVKPVGTSCDNAVIPASGDYYVTGRLVMGADGQRVSIGGYDLFYPIVTRRSAMEDMIDAPGGEPVSLQE